MARIKVALPPTFSFSINIPVRITDVNYGGHVGNDALLGIIHEARVAFLTHHGFSEMDMGGAALIMADVAIEFKAEAFYGDLIIASVACNDFQKVGFDICYKLEKEKDGIKTPVAFAKTGMVCFDYTARKIMAVPTGVKETLG